MAQTKVNPRDTMPDVLPADFSGWDNAPDVLPADFAGFDSAQVAASPQTAPQPEPKAQNWVEALFPRSSRAVNEGKGFGRQLAGATLDVIGGPGRAYASLARPEGETYQEALGRTQASPNQGWMDKFSEGILRDPALIPLSVMPFGAVAAKAPLLAKAFQAAKTGAKMGAIAAGSRQAENIAADKPLSGKEAAIDMSVGVGGGMLGAAVGSGAKQLKPAAIAAFEKLSKVSGPARKRALEAVPQMFQRGLVGPTINSTLGRLDKYGEEVSAAYNAATQGTQGVPAIPLSEYGQQAALAIEKAKDAGELTAREAADAMDWIMETAAGPKPIQGTGMVDVPTAVRLRSKARETAKAFTDNPAREARVFGSQELAGLINNELATVNPALREADKFAQLYYQLQPVQDALEKRSTNYGIGLMEGLGAAQSPTMAGKLAGGALMKSQRSMITPWALWKLGQLSEGEKMRMLSSGLLRGGVIAGTGK